MNKELHTIKKLLKLEIEATKKSREITKKKLFNFSLRKLRQEQEIEIAKTVKSKTLKKIILKLTSILENELRDWLVNYSVDVDTLTVLLKMDLQKKSLKSLAETKAEISNLFISSQKEKIKILNSSCFFFRKTALENSHFFRTKKSPKTTDEKIIQKFKEIFQDQKKTVITLKKQLEIMKKAAQGEIPPIV